jgi:DNA-binding transcriptional regulator GbsR (MarR family)
MQLQRIINLIRSNNYITVNKTLIKKIGLLPATFYGELLSRYNYFMERGLLKDGYFYLMIEDAKEEIGLSREEQDTAIRKLVKLGLIKKQIRKFEDDTTTRRYFKIVDDFELILSLFDEPIKVKKAPESIDKTVNVGFTQSELRELHNDQCGNYTTLQINNNKDIRLKNQSVIQMDGQTDEHAQKEIDTIINNARVETFEDDDLRETLKEVIRDCYNDTSTRATIRRLRVEHIDIAKAIYIDQQEIQAIKKPLEYFKKCLISAIQESGLKGLF